MSRQLKEREERIEELEETLKGTTLMVRIIIHTYVHMYGIDILRNSALHTYDSIEVPNWSVVTVGLKGFFSVLMDHGGVRMYVMCVYVCMHAHVYVRMHV